MHKFKVELQKWKIAIEKWKAEKYENTVFKSRHLRNLKQEVIILKLKRLHIIVIQFNMYLYYE